MSKRVLESVVGELSLLNSNKTWHDIKSVMIKAGFDF